MDARANEGTRLENFYFVGNSMGAVLAPVCAAFVWYFDKDWQFAGLLVGGGMVNLLFAIWLWRRRLHPERS